MAEYVVKGGRPLRLGYTTGSCASAAAAAAAEMLLGGKTLERVMVALPSGERVSFNLEAAEIAPGRASCAVVKDAGDDPDVTDGLKIFAECALFELGAPGLVNAVDELKGGFAHEPGGASDALLAAVPGVVPGGDLLAKPVAILDTAPGTSLGSMPGAGPDATSDAEPVDASAVEPCAEFVAVSAATGESMDEVSSADACEGQEGHVFAYLQHEGSGSDAAAASPTAVVSVRSACEDLGQGACEGTGHSACVREAEILLCGGEGIGRVVTDGLAVPKGEPAINPVPRRMIMENLRAVCARFGYSGGLRVTLSAPGGRALAQRTFNPRLGIEGGISILGTSGRVEPMSERAVLETIKLLIDKRHLADAENILIAPGNYGRDYCHDALGLDLDLAVKYSNFLGECLDYLVYKKFKRILLVGHSGKLIKAAGGIMNTHSSVADCRMEIIAAHAACLGAGPELARAVMQANSTEAALELLRAHGLEEAVCTSMLAKLLEHLRLRLDYRLAEQQAGPEIGVVVFSQGKSIMQSENALELLQFFSGAKR